MNVIVEADLPTVITGRAIRSVFVTDVNGTLVPRGDGRWLMAVTTVDHKCGQCMRTRPMRSRRLLWSGVGAVGTVGAIGGAWMLSLPPARGFASPPPIGKLETEALLAALKPPKRQRPVIASIGINDATETTDYLMPYGILRRADVADVVLLATQRRPVTLFPALKVQPHATVAEFDDRHPDGADYVIVPAMSRDDDPVVMEWLRSQAAKGALIVGVCAGAKVVAEAGLLDGKRATTHWYDLNELLAKHRAVRYVADRRIVWLTRVWRRRRESARPCPWH